MSKRSFGRKCDLVYMDFGIERVCGGKDLLGCASKVRGDTNLERKRESGFFRAAQAKQEERNKVIA